MGIERFQPNFRPLLTMIHWHREAILSPEKSVDGFWPAMTGNPKKDLAEISDRIYSFYSWNIVDRTRENRLYDVTGIRAFASMIYRVHQALGAKGYDSDYLFFRSREKTDARPVARLYFNYPHSDLSESRRLAGYLQREMIHRTRGIPMFKIAGPSMTEGGGNSAVVWLSLHGVRMRMEVVATVRALVRLGTITHYGVEALGPGAGFCYECRVLDAADWKYPYSQEGSTSFGTLLTAYLQRALQERPSASLEAFADRVAALMEADGINPLRIFELSENLREPEVRKLPDWR